MAPHVAPAAQLMTSVGVMANSKSASRMANSKSTTKSSANMHCTVCRRVMTTPWVLNGKGPHVKSSLEWECHFQAVKRMVSEAQFVPIFTTHQPFWTSENSDRLYQDILKTSVKLPSCDPI